MRPFCDLDNYYQAILSDRGPDKLRPVELRVREAVDAMKHTVMVEMGWENDE